jgi:ribosomal protein S18 acetylase RimI-like enzyme
VTKLVKIDGNDNLLKQIAALYQEVWNKEDKSMEERLVRHSGYEGFRGFVALSEEGEAVGYSYGYSSLPGQYYHGLLAKEFDEAGRGKWLKDSFEFVELAVHHSFRNQGLAKKLVNRLLEDVNHRKAVLTTQLNNNSARGLYESTGWIVLKESFYPNGEDDAYIIMGKELL